MSKPSMGFGIFPISPISPISLITLITPITPKNKNKKCNNTFSPTGSISSQPF